MPELTASTIATASGARSHLGIPQSAQRMASSSHTLQTIFQQLQQSLTVLSSASELVLADKFNDPASQPLRVWLQPNARQAEASLHRLREYRLIHIPATGELIQCLTVLVLAADMLIQGQLSDSGAKETYDLLRRNADRGMRALAELREQMLKGERA